MCASLFTVGTTRTHVVISSKVFGPFVFVHFKGVNLKVVLDIMSKEFRLPNLLQNLRKPSEGQTCLDNSKTVY